MKTVAQIATQSGNEETVAPRARGVFLGAHWNDDLDDPGILDARIDVSCCGCDDWIGVAGRSALGNSTD